MGHKEGKIHTDCRGLGSWRVARFQAVLFGRQKGEVNRMAERQTIQLCIHAERGAGTGGRGNGKSLTSTSRRQFTRTDKRTSPRQGIAGLEKEQPLPLCVLGRRGYVDYSSSKEKLLRRAEPVVNQDHGHAASFCSLSL